MSTSSHFCLQQRQQEQQQLKKLLTVGFTSSLIFHGLLAITLPHWSIDSPKTKDKPVELIIVDRPEPPKTKILPKPKPVKTVTPPPTVKQPEPVKPQPKQTPTETKIVPKPEPVKTVTPPPTVKQPEPIKPQPTPPKPATKRVLTSRTPDRSQPVISGVIKNTPPTLPLSDDFIAGNSTNSGSSEEDNSLEIKDADGVAVNSNPSPPTQSGVEEGIACLSNCEPEYPSVLEGEEGSAGIQLIIDGNGNVTSASVVKSNSNTEINRQALLAARQMKFSSPNSANSVSVKVTINFTVAGSDFDRQARQEKLQQEALRQQQLERERQARARQQQLERQRRAEIEKQRQVERQQQQPNSSETEQKDEMLRKFRERIDRHREQ
jgi:TonB family protein